MWRWESLLYYGVQYIASKGVVAEDPMRRVDAGIRETEPSGASALWDQYFREVAVHIMNIL